MSSYENIGSIGADVYPNREGGRGCGYVSYIELACVH